MKKWLPVIALCVVAAGLLVSSTILVWRNGAIRNELDEARALLDEMAYAGEVLPTTTLPSAGPGQVVTIDDSVINQLLHDAPDILARIFMEEVELNAETYIHLSGNRIIVRGQWHCDYLDETHTLEAMFRYRFQTWNDRYGFDLISYMPWYPLGTTFVPRGWFEGEPIWESPHRYDHVRTHALATVPMRFYSNGGEWDDFWYVEATLDGADFVADLITHAQLHLGRNITDAWFDGRIMYVDLHRNEPMRMGGGTFGEAIRHATLVSSLASVPDVDVVVILVNGQREAHFGGHGFAFRDIYLVDAPGVRLDAQRLPEGQQAHLSNAPSVEMDMRITDLSDGLQWRIWRTLTEHGISNHPRMDGLARAWLLDFNQSGRMDLIETVRTDYGSFVSFVVSAADGFYVFTGTETPFSTGPTHFDIAITEDGTFLLHEISMHINYARETFYRRTHDGFEQVLSRSIVFDRSDAPILVHEYFINDIPTGAEGFENAPLERLGVITFTTLDEIAIPVIVPTSMEDLEPTVISLWSNTYDVFGLDGRMMFFPAVLANRAWSFYGSHTTIPSLQNEFFRGSVQLMDEMLHVNFMVEWNEKIYELTGSTAGTAMGPVVRFVYDREAGRVGDLVFEPFHVDDAYPPFEFYLPEADAIKLAHILLRAKELVIEYRAS